MTKVSRYELVLDGYDEDGLLPIGRNETIRAASDISPQEIRLSPVLGANAIACVLSHNHAIYDQSRLNGVDTVKELQQIWAEEGQRKNRDSWMPGLEGWKEIGENRLVHTTGTGRSIITATDDNLELGFYTRGRTPEGDQVARVSFDTSREEGISRMVVEVCPDLLEGRGDRVWMLWEIDSAMDGVIVESLVEMVENGDEVAQILLDNYDEHCEALERAFKERYGE